MLIFNQNLLCLLSNSEIKYLSEKVHVHKWPQNTQIWDDFTQKQIDSTINKKTDKKQITIADDVVNIENIEFHFLKKIGVSIPFFKDECTLIFEAQFGELFAHVHITKKSGNFLELFNQLMCWKNNVFVDKS